MHKDVARTYRFVQRVNRAVTRILRQDTRVHRLGPVDMSYWYIMQSHKSFGVFKAYIRVFLVSTV